MTTQSLHLPQFDRLHRETHLQEAAANRLVSVIITCYNHGHFLSKAIQSVLEQTHDSIEIIVVDDGSSDDTRKIARGFDRVKYIYQKNQGLPAARNTGIVNSTGSYLVFLDADDWLLPNGIAANLRYFSGHNNIGLVSGNYMKFFEKTGEYQTREREIKSDTYADLLLYNHLRMHGAVMFPRFIFQNFQYDPKLRSGEDWDLTLAICRQYPVVQHKEPIAVYRKYGTSMTSNHIVMLESSLQVLKKQRNHIATRREATNLKTGCKEIKSKFSSRVYDDIVKRKKARKKEILILLKYNRLLFFKMLLRLAFYRLTTR